MYVGSLKNLTSALIHVYCPIQHWYYHVHSIALLFIFITSVYYESVTAKTVCTNTNLYGYIKLNGVSSITTEKQQIILLA
jgi:hypothetical protein